MRSVAACALVLCAYACAAEKWRWPEGTPAVRIDTKVHFIDADEQRSSHIKDESERQFEEPIDTDFYHQPVANAGPYPVRVVETYRDKSSPAYDYRKTSESQYSDGTLDSVSVQCKCVPKPECRLSRETPKSCGYGKYLCCYKRPHKKPQNTEHFNEVDNEQRVLFTENREFPGAYPLPPLSVLDVNLDPDHVHEDSKRPILVGPNGATGLIGPPNHNQGILTGPEGPTGNIGPSTQKQNTLIDASSPGSINRPAQHQPVLVGPRGPTGVIGPAQQKQPVLVGPGGPTGRIGPTRQNQRILVGPEGPSGIIGPKPQQNQALLIGPEGPTGMIGPAQHQPILVGPEGPTGSIGPQQNKNILVGPSGPTGVIGPGNKHNYLDRDNYDIGSSESAQRGVLVGPGGPTGFIGPAYYGGRPVLVGPGGPTGIIGPPRRGNRPVLIGPGGPTGIIGPPRPYYGK